MMKKTLMALMLTTALAACNGGGGGGGGGGCGSCGGGYDPGPVYVPTHADLAQQFVNRVNIELYGYNFGLAKANTLQGGGYIVTLDRDHGQYDAYDIGAWSPGQDIASYIRRYQNRFYYGLVPVGFNEYEDPFTGLRFEKQAATGKNLAQLKSFQEAFLINKAAEKIQVNYGLSAEKSLDAARFAYKLQTSPAGTYDVKDFDAFSKELVGSTVTEFQKDVKENNTVSLAKRIQTAAETTGMGAEGVSHLMSTWFGQ